MDKSFLIAIGIFIVVDVIIAIVLLHKLKKKADSAYMCDGCNHSKSEKEPVDFQIRG